VDYERFIDMVGRFGHLDREGAERATGAVLQTLAERLSRGEARDLLEQLPAEMKPWIYTESNIEPFDYGEFLRRVAEREGTEVLTAERHARAVFYALGSAITRDEVADVAAELPHDFARLINEALREEVDIMPADEFYRRVSLRSGLNDEDTRSAVNAVLETLAERLSHGEVEDLIAQLPTELHMALKRGDALSNGAARKMPIDKFLRLIAEREGATPQIALQHARAVFATLREAVSEKEFSDVTVQLPTDYTQLLARA
jgi:uncharacterized protein (DUF2267 family)